jgi:hypothetical protein
MKDWMKVLLAFAAIIGGAVCLFCAHHFFGFRNLWPGPVFGVVGGLLIVGGATYFKRR